MRYKTTLLALAVSLALHGHAAAQSEGTSKCQCLCQAGQGDDGGVRLSVLVHQNVDFSICPIFNDRKCEIRDSDRGDVHHGSTHMCEPLGEPLYQTIKSPPE